MPEDINPYASPTITEATPHQGRSTWRTLGRVALLGLLGCPIGGAIGGIAGGAGAATLGTVYIVASGGQPNNTLLLPADPFQFSTGIIAFGAMLGAVYGAMLGSSLGCLLGIIVALLKHSRRKRVTFWTAVVCGVGGALVGALGGGILGSPGSQAAWIPLGIIIGAMAGSAGGMALGYAMTSLRRFCFEPSERHG